MKPIDNEGFKNYLKAQGLKNLTINAYLTYTNKLRHHSEEELLRVIGEHNNKVCKAAMIQYFINYKRDHNFIGFINMKRQREEGVRKKVGLNESEWLLFIQGLRQGAKPVRNILIARLLRESGFRVSEVVRDDYNPKKGLRPTSFGEGNKITLMIKRHRWDDAYLTPQLYNDLKDYYHNKLGLDDHSNQLIFNICRCTLWGYFKDASELVGLRRVHPHLLKHTCSRDCDTAGLSPTEKSKILHHSKVSTTLDHYHNPEKRDIWRKKLMG